jgi:hypothetical protein
MKRTSEEIKRMYNLLKFISKDYIGLGFDKELNNLQAAVDEIEVIEEEKNDIIEAFNAGYSNGFMKQFDNAKDYYDKTFKK